MNLPLLSNSAPTSLITFPTSSSPSVTLLPTPPKIPYGLSPVTSSAEHANESIELGELVSDGMWVGRNVNLRGMVGGVPSPVGESGGVSGKFVCFVGVHLRSQLWVICFTKVCFSLLRVAGPIPKLPNLLPEPIDLPKVPTIWSGRDRSVRRTNRLGQR